jgi:hypothetical protein
MHVCGTMVEDKRNEWKKCFEVLKVKVCIRWSILLKSHWMSIIVSIHGLHHNINLVETKHLMIFVLDLTADITHNPVSPHKTHSMMPLWENSFVQDLKQKQK